MSSESNQKQRLKVNRVIIFLLTFFTYAGVYSTRTAYSYSKKQIQNSLNLSNELLGTIDMCFLICYSISLNIVGNFDIRNPRDQQQTQICQDKKNWANIKISLKSLLLTANISTSLIFISIAFFPIIGVNSFLPIFILMILNGFCQAPTWPTLVNIFGNWFKKGNRGLIMGIWSCCSNAGNIIGLQIGHMALITFEFEWYYSIIFSALFLLTMAGLNCLFLRPYPEDIGISIPDDNQKQQYQQVEQDSQEQQELIQISNKERKSSSNQYNSLDISTEQSLDQQEVNSNTNVSEMQQSKSLTYLEIVKIQGVLLYTIIYSCLKSTSYGLLFWLPKYLDEIGLEQQSASLGQFMQIGTLLGGVITGILSDKVGKRAIVMFPMLFISAMSLLVIKLYLDSTTVFLYYVFIFLVGATLGGPYSIICSAVSLDLSENPQLRNNKSALISITTFIEGLAAFSAAITQRVVPIVGNSNIFTFFFSLCMTASMLIFFIAIREFKELKQENQDQQQQQQNKKFYKNIQNHQNDKLA